MKRSKDTWVNMNEEDKACLWNIFSFCRSFKFDFPKLTKLPGYDNIFEFDNYHFRGFFRNSQSLKNSEYILDYILKNQKGFSKINSEVVKSSREFYRFGKKVLQLDAKKLTDKQLVKLFEEYDEIFTRNISFGMVTTLIDIPHGIFTRKVDDILAEQASLLGLKRSAPEYFSILTKIKELSGRQEESLGLLRMLEHIQEKKISTVILEKDKTLSKMAKEHVKKFCWVYYSYMGPAFGEERVFRELRNLVKEKKKAANLLKEFWIDYKKIKLNQQKAERELKLNAAQKIAIRGLRECMRMKVIRKDALDFASFSLENALKEVARRARIPFEDARFIAPGEFGKVLNGNKTIIKDLPIRSRYCLTIGMNNKVQLLSGKKAKNFFKKIHLEEGEVSAGLEIKGQVACPGVRTGKVKIINLPSDMGKMQKGDILVSFATIPDLVPAMKKAAAIVTEQGGITSHAAIVSRELGIPCVIGTKIATKVFKDGDMVEVDANKGIVRKI